MTAKQIIENHGGINVRVNTLGTWFEVKKSTHLIKGAITDKTVSDKFDSIAEIRRIAESHRKEYEAMCRRVDK